MTRTPLRPELAAAVQDLLDACGVSSAICGMTGDLTEDGAAEMLRFAARLARKESVRRKAVALEAAANRFLSFLPDNNRALGADDRVAASEIVKAYRDAYAWSGILPTDGRDA